MLDTTTTLYKLIILYTLGKVNFPMTNSQITNLMLSEDYTRYFQLQEILQNMIDSGLVKTEVHNHTTYYSRTEKGAKTVEYFKGEISPEIRRDISNYLVLHSYEMRSESSCMADYYRSADMDYTVSCRVREGNTTLIEMKLSVPTEKAAQTLAENWKAKSQEDYAAVMNLFM